MATQHEQALADRFLNKRVKRSWRTLRTLYFRYLACSQQPRKRDLGEEYSDQNHHRGTVIAIIAEDVKLGIVLGLKVKWDHGLESKCMPYEIDIVK